MTPRAVALVAGIGLLLLSRVPTTTPWLVWNASTSVPLGLYAIRPGPVRDGDLALVRLPPETLRLAWRRGYLNGTAFVLKPVAASAGARICRFGRDIRVNGRLVVIARAHDAQRRRLPVWRGCQTVTTGAVLLLADHPHSFDGRYFGVVPADLVIGSATALWTPHHPPTQN
jgi:conjugative transfer signal peptidase TraF